MTYDSNDPSGMAWSAVLSFGLVFGCIIFVGGHLVGTPACDGIDPDNKWYGPCIEFQNASPLERNWPGLLLLTIFSVLTAYRVWWRRSRVRKEGEWGFD